MSKRDLYKLASLALVMVSSTASAQPRLNIERLSWLHHKIDAHDVAVQGDYAYIAAEYEGLNIVDVSDPAYPVLIGKRDGLCSVFRVNAAGSLALVIGSETDDGAGSFLFLVDISNPREPVTLSMFDPEWAYDAAVAEEMALVTCAYGLKIVDISDPTQPTELGSYELYGWRSGGYLRLHSSGFRAG